MITSPQKKPDILDLYRNRDENHPQNAIYDAPSEEFDGPVAQRTCTDLACIPIFIALLIYTLLYTYQCKKLHQKLFFLFDQSHSHSASIQNDYSRIYFGLDFRADVCGQLQLQNRPYQFILNPGQWGELSICVEQCPNQTNSNQTLCLYDPPNKQILEDYCYTTYYAPQYRQYCMPLELNSIRSQIESVKSSQQNFFKLLAGDFVEALSTIIGSMCLQIFFGLLYLVSLLIKKGSHVFLWSFIILFCVAIGYISVYIDEERLNVISKDCPQAIIIPAPNPYDCVPQHLIFLDVIKYLTYILIPIYSIFMLASFNKILAIIQILNQTVQMIKQQPLVLIIPIITSILQALFGVIFLIIFISGASAGAPQTVPAPPGFASQNYRALSIQIWQQNGMYIILVFYFWILQILYYYCRISVSIVTSTWYFSRDKTYVQGAIRKGIWYTLRYHLGSAIFAASILPFTWILSAILYYYRKLLEQLKSKNSYLVTLTKPLLTLYEYALKYFSNRNFMNMALFGESFIISGQRIFYLRERNISRVNCIKDLIGYARIIGMLFASSTGTYLVYFQLYSQQIINNQSQNQIEFPILPSLFVFIQGLYLSQNFSSVIDIVIETIFFDLIADEEIFNGSQRYAEQDFVQFVNKFSKEKEKQEFIVINRGKVNPLADKFNNFEIIKPIDKKDLVDQDDDDVEYIYNDEKLQNQLKSNQSSEQEEDEDIEQNNNDEKYKRNISNQNN